MHVLIIQIVDLARSLICTFANLELDKHSWLRGLIDLLLNRFRKNRYKVIR